MFETYKSYRNSETCSHSCSNKHKRVKTNRAKKNKLPHYKEICFKTHGKKCWVCGEKKIVSVHHVNHKHYDDSPENLAPLCPTHHQYLHSRYKNEILPIVKEYIDRYMQTINIDNRAANPK